MSPSSRFVTFAGWPRLEIHDRGDRVAPGSGWLFVLEMRHPNPGPHDLAVVNANGGSFDVAAGCLRDCVDDWHRRRAGHVR